MSQNFDHQFKQLSLKFFLSLGLILFLLIVTSLTYQAVFQKQDLRKKASESISQLPTKDKRPIFLVELLIDNVNSSIEITSLQKGFGFVPDYRNPEALDYLAVDIVGSENDTANLLIPVPVKEVYAPPREEGKKLNYPPRILDKLKYTIVLPYDDSAQITINKHFPSKTGAQPLFNKTIIIQLPASGGKNGVVRQNSQIKEIDIGNLSPKYFELGQNPYVLETIYDGNPSLTNPLDTLDIVFVSSGFDQTNSNLFQSFTTKQADALFGFADYSGKSPFKDNKRVVKIRRLITPDTYHSTNNGYTSVDFDRIIRTLAALGIPYDQFSVVLHADGRSYSTLGGQYNVLFRTWGGFEERTLLFAHEFGHSFSALLDEYVEYWETYTTDLSEYGRNCKEDPDENWLDNTAGGSYLGCNYYLNLYRPELSSLMSTIGDEIEFNEPSKRLIEHAFSAYTQNGMALVILPGRSVTYNRLNNPITYPITEQFTIRNIGLATSAFHWKFNPEVSWIKNIRMPEFLPGIIYFDIDYPRLNARGSYETVLDLKINGTSIINKKIPIKVVVGDENDVSSINIVGLLNGQIIEPDSIIDVPLTYNSPKPGFKRVNLYIFGPWSDPNNDFYKYLTYTRTVSPYQSIFKNYDDYGNNYKGTFTLMAEAYPFFGQPAKSNKIDLEVKAVPGTRCQDQYFHQCKNSKTSRQCFLGADDCINQGLNYCCPISTPTPSVSVSVSPTVTSTPTPTNSPTPSWSPTPTATPIPNTKPFFTSSYLPAGQINKKYYGNITASDNDYKDKLSMTFKNLPSWLSKGPCKSTVNKFGRTTIDCSLSGTPVKKGYYIFFAIVSDKNNASAVKKYEIFVNR